MLTIRLSRSGAKKRPFYHVQVAERRGRRDGRFVEQLGYYNPIAQGQAHWLKLDLERVDHWLSVGAKPTETVARLIQRARAGEAVVPGAAGEDDAAPVTAEAAAGEQAEGRQDAARAEG